MPLFKKIACFTDLHLGLKNNNLTHLQDCEDFIDWFIEQSHKQGCETAAFLGDWHHFRNSINFVTLDTSLRCLEKLGKAFDQFYWFPGNHDLFYRDKREVHSTVYGKHIPGLTIIDKVTTIDDVTFVPWLVGEEWKEISKIKSRYMFGHLELPRFYMNAMVQMPDHGQLQSNHFIHQEYVFSGHFHKRQNQGKIWYIGNAFPHNYADTWDDDRGMMTLEWNGIPQFIAWPDAPKYRTLSLSQFMDKADDICKSKMYLKINLDIDVTFEEANFLRDTFLEKYNIRELSLINEKQHVDIEESNIDISFSSVDQIVSQELTNISSEQFDTSVLLDIFRKL
jgi:DNA repair exonuclease SbcCD nuclease subunit